MSQFVKLVKRNNLLREYVGVLNGYLGLTDRQSQVLSELLNLSLTMKGSILSKGTRRAIIDKTGVGYCNLSSILTLLKMKGVLVKDSESGWRVQEQYLPQVDNDNCYINLTLKIE